MDRNRSGESPFADLPAALVEKMLDRTEDISRALLDSFREMRDQRAEWREELKGVNLLQQESDLEYVPIPTTCGVDGSYGVERLLATDLVAA
ncbi:MAG: nuclease, partial [Anaerolineae bacterium]